jgi:hypothetical protein
VGTATSLEFGRAPPVEERDRSVRGGHAGTKNDGRTRSTVETFNHNRAEDFHERPLRPTKGAYVHVKDSLARQLFFH